MITPQTLIAAPNSTNGWDIDTAQNWAIGNEEFFNLAAEILGVFDDELAIMPLSEQFAAITTDTLHEALIALTTSHKAFIFTITGGTRPILP